MKSSVAIVFAALSLGGALQAGPLTEARVTKIINDVAVIDPASGARKAELQQLIKDQLGLKTGIKSRSELLFEDNTLTRIGPESYFSFKAGTRDMTLEQGTMLLQVPKGLGGAKIRTAAVTAAITGTTIMMEYRPKQSIKVLVLEGSLRLSVNGKMGEALTLRPGQMILMPANATKIPAPVDVDIARVMKTSSLVNMSKGTAAPLPSLALIRAEIVAQEKAKADRTLATTNLVINGSGNDVRVTANPIVETAARRNEQPTVGSAPAAPSNPPVTANPATGGVPATGATPPPTTSVPATGATPPPTTGNGNNGNGNNGNNGNHGNGNNGNGNGNNGNHGNGNNGNGNGNNGGNNGNHGNGNNGNGNGNGGSAALSSAVVPVKSSDQLLGLLEGATPTSRGSMFVAPDRATRTLGASRSNTAFPPAATSSDAPAVRNRTAAPSTRSPRANPLF